MAARRLLIVMLILLGLSTLAAALVPQHALRGGAASSTATTTTTESTTTTASPPPGRSLGVLPIVVGGNKIPVVAGPICPRPKARCEPSIHVGDQMTLQVYTRKGQAELAVPSLGVYGVASPTTPALFDLLPDHAGSIGIVYASTNRVAARLDVVSVKAARAEAKRENAKRAG